MYLRIFNEYFSNYKICTFCQYCVTFIICLPRLCCRSICRDALNRQLLLLTYLFYEHALRIRMELYSLHWFFTKYWSIFIFIHLSVPVWVLHFSAVLPTTTRYIVYGIWWLANNTTYPYMHAKAFDFVYLLTQIHVVFAMECTCTITYPFIDHEVLSDATWYYIYAEKHVHSYSYA